MRAIRNAARMTSSKSSGGSVRAKNLRHTKSCIETRQFLSPAEKMFDCHHDRERGGMSVGSPGPLLDGDDHPPETIQLLIGRQLSEPAPGAWRQPGAQHPFVGLQETLDAHFIKLRQAAKQ